MELLRITSASNNKIAYLALFLSIPMSIASVVFAIAAWGEATVMSLIFGATGVLLLFLSVVMLKGLVAPFQREFVIEPDRFRFGRADRIEKQRVILRSEVDCLIFDDAEPSLSADTGKQWTPFLALGIIQDKSQMVAVIRAIQENWMEIPIYDRIQYQARCRQKCKKS